MKYDESSQWLHEGNCSACRRQSYCRKRCSANNKQLNAAIGRAFTQIFMKGTSKIMKSYVDRSISND